jgi:AcrR family transcriptional regulator
VATSAPQGSGSPKRAPRGRGRPTDQSGDETRSAILAAAQRLFGQRGFAGVSMDAIAAACEVNARAIYYHFASKQELFDAVTDAAFTRFGHEVVDRVLIQPTLRRRLDGYVDVYRSLHASDPDLVRFIGVVLLDQFGGRSPSPPSTMASAQALPRFVETVVDEAIANGEVDGALDRDGLVMLVQAIGMGLALASLTDTGAYGAMLDAFDRFTAGTVFRTGDGTA